MTCADFEILICDYVDGALPPGLKAELERHLSGCPVCAELARDSAAAVSFMERAADVEPPPELLTRILFDPPWVKAKPVRGSGIRRWLSSTLHPLLQPRLAMGMAMTVLFFSMMARCVGVPKLTQKDLEPAYVWAALDDRVYRSWQRTVKFYESIRFLYQVRNRLQEWQQQQDEEQRATGSESSRPDPNADFRRLPLKNSPPPNATPRPSETTGKPQ